MSSVAFVSDSTASLSSEFVDQYGITVVPLYVRFGEEIFRDGVDITSEEFYARLPHCKELPSTSQPSVGDFVDAYSTLVERGADEIISVHISSAISGTVNSARLAAEQVKEARITVIDTECAVAAHNLALQAGVQAASNGADYEQSVEAVRRVVASQKTIFMVDTLEYLYKGGRIGGAEAFFGSLLQFKPLLYFNDGRIDALERVRKSKRSLLRMTDIMCEWMGPDEPVRLITMHAACPDRIQTVVDLLKERVSVASQESVPLSPVIGAHVGNGCLGICCCPASHFAGFEGTAV